MQLDCTSPIHTELCITCNHFKLCQCWYLLAALCILFSCELQHWSQCVYLEKELNIIAGRKNRYIYVHMNNQWTTLFKENRPRCYAKSPTAQDVFQPIPGFSSCAGVTERWGLLSHAQNAVRWLALSKKVDRSSSKRLSLCAAVHQRLSLKQHEYNRRFSADVTRMQKFDYYSADHTLGGSHTFLMYCGLWGKPDYECISASNSACKIATW